ncbi:MAG TPA: hypothetical protein VEY95_04490 [Azospirillaceae bacterium]|nr:hypothetical protein [Azospirillaceae bacterium]
MADDTRRNISASSDDDPVLRDRTDPGPLEGHQSQPFDRAKDIQPMTSDPQGAQPVVSADPPNPHDIGFQRDIRSEHQPATGEMPHGSGTAPVGDQPGPLGRQAGIPDKGRGVAGRGDGEPGGDAGRDMRPPDPGNRRT